MVEGLDSARRLVLLLMKNYGKPMERRAIHAILYAVSQSVGIDLGFHGKYPYSLLIDQQLSEMINEGLLRRLYIVGPHFMELYREYISLGEKGRELANRLDEPELEKVIREHLKQLDSKQGGEVAQA
ncbi:MAG: hypothetical protein QXF87_07035 [Thermofilaceae archaeon]